VADIQAIEIYRIYFSTLTHIDFANQLLAHMAIEIKPMNDDEHIHFPFPAREAKKRKLGIMMGIMEPVWKKIYYININPHPPIPPQNSPQNSPQFLQFPCRGDGVDIFWDDTL